MPIQKLFTDESSDLKMYVNTENNLFIDISHRDDEDYSGMIVLDLEDAIEMQKELSECINQMKPNE